MDILNIKPTLYAAHMNLPAKTPSINITRESLLADLKSFNLPDTVLRAIRLSVDEAVTNAVEHGSLKADSEIAFAYTITRDSVEISVTDFGGHMFNPDYFERLATVKDWGAGGRGILFIKAMVDEVYFVFNPNRSTRLIMKKKFFPTPPANKPA